MASLALLADMTAQAKAIEIMISHAYDVSCCPAQTNITTHSILVYL